MVWYMPYCKTLPGNGKINQLPTGEMVIDIDKENIVKTGVVPIGYQDKIVVRIHVRSGFRAREYIRKFERSRF